MQGRADYTKINEMLTVMGDNFWINPILLIAPVLVVVMVILKIPAISGLIDYGTRCYILIYSRVWACDVVGFVHYGYESATGHEMVDAL